MRNVNVHVDSRSDEDDEPRDAYAQSALLAREQSVKFYEKVKEFLTRNAGYVRGAQNVHHLGRSTVSHRLSIPLYLEDRGLANIILYFTARTKSELEESMAMITSQKEFEVFKQVPFKPDPMLYGSLDS